MKRYRRGFGHHDERLIVISIILILMAILFPVFHQVLKHTHRAGLSTSGMAALATVWTVVSCGVVFGVLPLLFVFPIACVVFLRQKSSEKFRDVLVEYWLIAFSWTLGLLMLAGVCLTV